MSYNILCLFISIIEEFDSIKNRLRKRPTAINSNGIIPAKRSCRQKSAPAHCHVQNVRNQNKNRPAGVSYASPKSSKANGTSKAKKTSSNDVPNQKGVSYSSSSGKSNGPSMNAHFNSVTDKLIDINCTLLADVDTLNNECSQTTDAIISLQAEKHLMEVKCLKLTFKIDKLEQSLQKVKELEEARHIECRIQSQNLIMFDDSSEEQEDEVNPTIYAANTVVEVSAVDDVNIPNSSAEEKEDEMNSNGDVKTAVTSACEIPLLENVPAAPEQESSVSTVSPAENNKDDSDKAPSKSDEASDKTKTPDGSVKERDEVNPTNDAANTVVEVSALGTSTVDDGNISEGSNANENNDSFAWTDID